MYCISVSYKKTPLVIRQQFSFSREEQSELLARLKEKRLIYSGVVVSTCNRSEIYFMEREQTVEQVEQVISAIKGIAAEDIKTYCLYYQGKMAVRHLYKVTCGLDSMVLGEDEILRQVKEAYLFSVKEGFSDGRLNIIFQGAFHCAKRSKSGTHLSDTPVSIGTLAANMVEDYIGELPETQRSHCVLVIGASGKIGSIVAKDLLAKGFFVYGTKRSHVTREERIQIEHERMCWVEFGQRYAMLPQVSVVVSATSSPHYTITKKEFLRQGKHQCLFIDLAVPNDIDRMLADEPGICVRDIDYFKIRSKENNCRKRQEADKAEVILENCVEDILKKLMIQEFQSKPGIKPKWVLKMIFYLRDVLSSDQLAEVLSRIEM